MRLNGRPRRGAWQQCSSWMSTACHFQDPIGSYGANNKQKMQEVSKKYDPEGVFQKAVVGGFKLFSSS